MVSLTGRGFIYIFKTPGPERWGICIFEGEPKHYSRVAPPSSEYLAEGISDPTNFSGESLLQNM